jgi:Holliday junction resolvasome RuvABC DNA-binding subunit
MRGDSAEDKRGVSNKAMALYGFACHKGSRLFETLEPSNREGAKMAME